MLFRTHFADNIKTAALYFFYSCRYVLQQFLQNQLNRYKNTCKLHSQVQTCMSMPIPVWTYMYFCTHLDDSIKTIAAHICNYKKVKCCSFDIISKMGTEAQLMYELTYVN